VFQPDAIRRDWHLVSGFELVADGHIEHLRDVLNCWHAFTLARRRFEHDMICVVNNVDSKAGKGF